MIEHGEATVMVVKCDFYGCSNKRTSFSSKQPFAWADNITDEWYSIYAGPGVPSEHFDEDPTKWLTICPEHPSVKPMLEVIKLLLDKREL